MCGDRDLRGFATEFLLDRFDRIVARRHASQRKPAILTGHGKERVADYRQKRSHPWMRAFLSVVSHPFFAVTGEDGGFTLRGVPPGNYTVEAIQEKFGRKTAQVTVAAHESKTVDF